MSAIGNNSGTLQQAVEDVRERELAHSALLEECVGRRAPSPAVRLEDALARIQAEHDASKVGAA